MTPDPHLESLFWEETAANANAARRVLASIGNGAPPPEGRTTVLRAFHILAGTAGLVGHADWGRVAAAAEAAMRRWGETGLIGAADLGLIRDTLNAVAALAEGQETPDPMVYLKRWSDKGY